MGFTAKTSKSSSSSEGWGMGFFLVFFPENEPPIDINTTTATAAAATNNKTTTNLFSPIKIRRTNSIHLLSRAQSTISVCAFLIFLSLLVFTLSTFEPTTTHFTSRRHLSSSNPQFRHKPNKISPRNPHPKPEITDYTPPHALQGMGNLYRRGTRAMNDLIVGHVTESVTEQELRLFLRLLHRSSLSSKSDLVLVFQHPSHSSAFQSVILEEEESFSKLVNRSRGVKSTKSAGFDATQFVKSSKKEREWGEPIWGRRIRSNYSEIDVTESTRLSYGSVVSFVADELDPENSLAGFLDHVPMSMRRWACYPMLLGRVKRNFKHIMLVDVREVLLLGDPLSRVRSRSPESVHLSAESNTTPNTNNSNKHGKKNSAKTQLHRPVNSAVVMGGARGVRRLSNSMLTEIVRVTTQHKRKNPITESGLFNQLVGNEFLVKSVKVAITSTESIPDAGSLTGLDASPGSSLSLSNYSMVRRGNSNIDVTSGFMKLVCSLEVDSLVYSDCL